MDKEQEKMFHEFCRKIQLRLLNAIQDVAGEMAAEGNAVQFNMNNFAYSLGCASSAAVHSIIRDIEAPVDLKKDQLDMARLFTGVMAGWDDQTRVILELATKESILAEPENKPLH